jgi:hypothetical protein
MNLALAGGVTWAVPILRNRTRGRPQPFDERSVRLRRSPIFVRCQFHIFLSKAEQGRQLARIGTADTRLE